MLQNRVNPFGEVICTPARGAWMGNRGAIHNDSRQITRSHRVIAWITCTLKFKDRHRQVMSPGKYTELFFLDEATAFSAGHRPCQECRRAANLEFRKRWTEGNPQYHYTAKTRINDIDTVIHDERITPAGEKRTYTERLDTLPDGTFVAIDQTVFLVKGDKLFPWNPDGYGFPVDRPADQVVTVLTPPSIVNAFCAGYVPQTALRQNILKTKPI
jgi:hypothetical protein